MRGRFVDEPRREGGSDDEPTEEPRRSFLGGSWSAEVMCCRLESAPIPAPPPEAGTLDMAFIMGDGGRDDVGVDMGEGNVDSVMPAVLTAEGVGATGAWTLLTGRSDEGAGWDDMATEEAMRERDKMGGGAELKGQARRGRGGVRRGVEDVGGWVVVWWLWMREACEGDDGHGRCEKGFDDW